MNPMQEHKAYDMKQRLSILYMIIAWNAGGYCLYQIFSGNKSWPKTVGIRTDEEDMVRPGMQKLNMQNMTILAFMHNY